MAEIRSTLDIIMEKTKNMTMSDEEKTEFQKQNLSGKFKGYAQKYLDGIIGIKEIKSEIDSEKSKTPIDIESILKNELVTRLDPESDNTKVFELMREFLNININLLEEAIGKFYENIIEEKMKKMETLRQVFSKKQISGPAVVPNIEKDASWQSFYKESIVKCKQQLSIIADKGTIDAR
jgi:hypothetical protein